MIWSSMRSIYLLRRRRKKKKKKKKNNNNNKRATRWHKTAALAQKIRAAMGRRNTCGTQPTM